MNWISVLNEIVVIIGVPTIVGVFIFIGRKFQVLDDLVKTVHAIKENVKVISDFLTKKFTDFNVSEIRAYSPRTLTDIGEGFIKKLGFDKVFEEHKDDFFEFIDGENPKVKYDVENSAIRSILALSDEDYMSFLKIFFYNNPDRNLNNTAATLGLYVRDLYLEAHPEITQ